MTWMESAAWDFSRCSSSEKRIVAFAFAYILYPEMGKDREAVYSMLLAHGG